MPVPQFTNRLIKEKSPYLLQNAHTPVDWYPWGEEAFDLAKKLDKPIFLSIGYATCHWCHVMEKETFQNVALAEQMNEAFINIKVDREEMPHVDNVYMELAQALMSSSGGWPLNLVLTPDLKPFFAATYLPPVNRRGLIGMEQFIRNVRQLWDSADREHLTQQADKVFALFERSSESAGEEMASEGELSLAVEALYELIDPVYGGLKGEPKFPMSYQALFLLEFAKTKKDTRALFCAELTLDQMLCGGIYDQLAGGFARYAVDEEWVIPHFEKMLYDNALLVSVYLSAWKYLKKENYRTASQETLDYVLREMTSVEGGFYSAEDADSEGKEGMFYTWTKEEIEEVLSPEEANLFSHYYGITLEPNFEGRNVLHIADPSQTAPEGLASAKRKLFQKRQTREHPFKDDKIIVSWNGLMIDAMIKAAGPLGQPAFKEAALKAAGFIKSNLCKEGRLLRRWRDGEARFPGGLDDYAFLIKGLISLFEENCGSSWLQFAIELTDVLEQEFKAPGGAFYSHLEDLVLLMRRCEYYDGAEPSGNAVHSENLLRLYQITQNEKYLAQAEDIFRAAKQVIDVYPPGACYHLLSLHRYFNQKAPTVIIALDEAGSLQNEIQAILYRRFIPHAAIVWKGCNDPFLSALVDKNPIDGQTTVYICRQSDCGAPLVQKEQILKALEEL
jgi:uncharacterized protein YyaL (SSP411 family)